MVKFLFSAILLAFCVSVSGQTLTQYFDDTTQPDQIKIILDTAAQNVWQIGRLQKLIFDSAATKPNALVTDTVNTYPVNDTSRFYVGMKPYVRWGIFALEWMQKLDMDKKFDGGIVEFSLDSGATWQNVFNNPLVYNFYGFDTTNKDTIVSGQYAFTGTDNVWRDIWLCFDFSFLSHTDSVAFRFTMLSDGVDSMKDGWIIDNMMMKMTYKHGVVRSPGEVSYMKVYPTSSSGIVHIEGDKKAEYYIIQHMVLRDLSGKVIRTYGVCPTKYWIDISDLPNGNYLLEINTNFDKVTYPLILNK